MTPDVKGYVDLIDAFLAGSLTATEIVSACLRMVKSERRVLSESVFLMLQNHRRAGR